MNAGTTYPIRISTNDLVTHNAAVLGILGVGKTFLAMELVERMLLDGIRVIYLDLTNQYEEELAPYVDVEEQEEVLADLEELGAEGKDNLQKHVEEGGSIQQFSAQVIKVVASFLDPTAENQLDRPEPV